MIFVNASIVHRTVFFFLFFQSLTFYCEILDFRAILSSFTSVLNSDSLVSG